MMRTAGPSPASIQSMKTQNTYMYFVLLLLQERGVKREHENQLVTATNQGESVC